MTGSAFRSMEDAAAIAGVPAWVARWVARTFGVPVCRVDGVEHVDPRELLRWTGEDPGCLAPAPSVARLSFKEGLGGTRSRT